MAQFGHEGRWVDQWNRRESWEIDLHIYGQWTFDSGTKAMEKT